MNTSAGASRRTHQPVFAGSRLAGTFEHEFKNADAPPDYWRELNRKFRRAWSNIRKGGKWPTSVIHSAGKVYHYLTRLAALYGGSNVFPPFAQIARACDICIETARQVVRCIEEMGWLVRHRRAIQVDAPQVGRCPSVQQTSNAYELLEPEAAAVLVGEPLPIPDDEAEREAERLRQADAHDADWAALTPAEQWARKRPWSHRAARVHRERTAPTLDERQARIERLVAARPAVERAEYRALLIRLDAEAEARRSGALPDAKKSDESGGRDSFVRGIRAAPA